ncbi:MAG: Fic family protein [Clostridiales bacterium]|nr:Fic family protein [Clostridiales bacterium]
MTKQELISKADYYRSLIAVKKPLDSEHKTALANHFRLACICGSNALEGSILSHDQIRSILEDVSGPEEKDKHNYKEIIGHAQAYDYMLSLALTDKLELSEDNIKRLHYLLYHRIDDRMAGQYREVCIQEGAGYQPPGPEELAHLMSHFINQMQSSKRLLHPVEYATLCHKRLLDIQPFEKGNGIVARLLLNLILITEGYGMAVFALGHMDEYADGLRLSRKKIDPDIDPLVRLVAECLVNTQIEYCKWQEIEQD